MRISDFDYELPEELIAQHPPERRDAARMLVINRERGDWRDSLFSGLPGVLKEGDLVVVNNTRVFPARLTGRREPSGGRVELLLIREASGFGECVWEALARPARRLSEGSRISFGNGRLRAQVLATKGDGPERVVRFESECDFDALLEELGRMPLPPYIKREDEDLATRDEDRERYQTIYAGRRGSIAAPTAGLHFTSQVVEELKARGVLIAEVTLHVGYGTFAPVRVDDLGGHSVAPEHFEIPAAAAKQINGARAEGRRVVAVGTTTVRALESAIDAEGGVRAGVSETGLTITPGYSFRAVDALLTNFHLPRSSLLVLVAAFAGRELVLAAYGHAVKARYRFYSYGDCMLIS
ncbi:MAG: tRNA preQ1(34) S-adenosylmethionine ribosyltransferase-isomerase QueA [Acidobacteria bacterium]|nr:tRNA preQ1(34) S-adenosylmethionine ribosyltransferase-isomerase QueA [Acidobacteriota bacterium]